MHLPHPYDQAPPPYAQNQVAYTTLQDPSKPQVDVYAVARKPDPISNVVYADNLDLGLPRTNLSAGAKLEGVAYTTLRDPNKPQADVYAVANAQDSDKPQVDVYAVARIKDPISNVVYADNLDLGLARTNLSNANNHEGVAYAKIQVDQEVTYATELDLGLERTNMSKQQPGVA